MTDLVASVRLKADGSGLVGQAREASAAVQGIGTAAVAAGADARALTTGTAAAEAGMRALTTTAGGADRALDGVGAAAQAMAADQRQAAMAVGALENQLERNVVQARDTAAAVRTVGTAAAAVGGDAQALATGAAAAETGMRSLAAGAAGADRALAEVGAAAKTLATDGRQAAAAIDAAGAATVAAGNGVRALAAGTAVADTGTRGLATSAAVADRALDGLGAAAQGMAVEQRQAAAAIGVLEGRIGTSNTAFRVGAADANRHAFAVRNAGQQVGDFGLQVATGQDPVRAGVQQIGQLAYAMSDMGGKAGAVGAFLTGPWGIALTVAGSIAAPFIQQLFEGGKAANEQRERLEQAAGAADSYGAAQTLLGKIVDLSTGKIRTQNVALRQQIGLLAQANILDAQKRQQTAADAVRGVGAPTFREEVTAGVTGTTRALIDPRYRSGSEAADLKARLAPVKDVVDGYVRLTEVPGASQGALDKGLNATLRSLDALGRSGKLAGRDLLDAKSAVVQLATALNDQRANQQVVDVLNGGAVPDELKPYARGKTPKKTKAAAPASTAARDEFGRDAAAKLAGLTEQFDATPAALRKTNAEIRQLDDLIDDLSRKKPPGFEQLVAGAEAAKVTIRRGLIDGIAEAFDKPRTLADQATVAFGQLDAIAADLERRKPPGYGQLLADVERGRDAVRDGLVRPFDEFVAAQAQSLQIGALLAAGQGDQAEALRTIVQLERQMGPLTDAQKSAVLATTQALAAQERQVERLHRRQQVYLNALGDVQAIVRQTIYDGPGGLKELPGRLTEAFKRFAAERLTESLFGGVFEKLRDQVTGTDVVEDASTRMADAVTAVADHTARTTGALDELARSSRGAAQALASPAGFGTTRDAAGGIASDLLDRGAGVGQLTTAIDEIVVTGRRQRQAPSDPFAGSIGQIATALGKKIGIDDAKAEKIGSFVGGAASKGLRGAVEGQAAASLAGLFGIKTSGTGSSIGGAIGAISGIPGGSIIGGLLGGVVGGLFQKTKTGSATIGAVDGEAAVTGTGGSSAAYRKAASGLGSAVSDSINAIVQQLGGELGSFAVSIGQRGDKYVVDNSGRGSTKYGKANDGITAYDSAEEAQAAALANALADGAVKGVSAAVAKALQSSTDVDKAVTEALKVQQLETLLGGVGGQLTQVFRQFDAEATERVRLAKKYGLDLLQVEKVNAEQRTALVEQQLAATTGSLRDLLTSLTSGDLFEGTAGERRTAILAEIDKAKADAAAGVDGANDRVAQLLGQLVTTSKEAFGTAGDEYGGDRAVAAAEAARLIKIEEDRVRAAAGEQAATTKAVEAVGVLANEGNDLLADANRLLETIATGVAALGGSFRVEPDLSLVTYRSAY